MTSIILGQRTSCYNVSTFLITSGTVVTARHDRCVQIEDLILRIGPIRLRGRQRSSCHGYRRGSVSYSRANYQSILRTIFLTLQRSLVYKNAVQFLSQDRYLVSRHLRLLLPSVQNVKTGIATHREIEICQYVLDCEDNRRKQLLLFYVCAQCSNL